MVEANSTARTERRRARTEADDMTEFHRLSDEQSDGAQGAATSAQVGRTAGMLEDDPGEREKRLMRRE